MKFYRVLFTSFFYIFVNCLSFNLFYNEKNYNPYVFLTYHDKVNSVKILLDELKIKSEIVQTIEPFTNNSFAVISIGENFPYDKLIEILRFIRNYYPELRYIDLIQKQDKVPENVLYQMHIGMSTEIAIKKQLKAWNSNDFENLKKVKSQEEMKNFILSKNQKSNYSFISSPIGQ